MVLKTQRRPFGRTGDGELMILRTWPGLGAAVGFPATRRRSASRRESLRRRPGHVRRTELIQRAAGSSIATAEATRAARSTTAMAARGEPIARPNPANRPRRLVQRRSRRYLRRSGERSRRSSGARHSESVIAVPSGQRPITTSSCSPRSSRWSSQPDPALLDRPLASTECSPHLTCAKSRQLLQTSRSLCARKALLHRGGLTPAKRAPGAPPGARGNRRSPP
jgi:hypothetical protein